MGPDRMSSHGESAGFNNQYSTMGPKQSQSIGAPFTRDVLEALERGDVNGAMRLIDGHNGVNPVADNIPFMLVLKQLAKGLFSIPKKLFASEAQKVIQKNPTIEKVEKDFTFKSQITAKMDEIIKSMLRLISRIGEMIAQRGNDIARPFQKIDLSQLIQKILVPAKDAFAKVKTSIQTMLSYLKMIPDFIVNLDRTKVKDMALFIATKVTEVIKPVSLFMIRQYDAVAEQLAKMIALIDKATEPYREKVKEVFEKVVEVVEATAQWMKAKVEVVTDPMMRFFEHMQKELSDRAKEWSKKGVEAITEVKDKVFDAVTAVIQPFQQIPEVVAAYAFWFVRHTVTPVGNIKQNIIHIGNQIKKAAGWVMAKGISAGEFMQRAAVAIGKGCAAGAKWIAAFVENKIIPLLLRFLRWLGLQIQRFALWLIRVLRLAAKKSMEIARWSKREVLAYAKKLGASMREKFHQFKLKLLKLTK